MNPAADQTLVSASIAGDRAAFADLVARHWPLLISLCTRMTRDRELAHDAAQEALLQAMVNLGRLRRPDRFGPWLAGIGLNICRRRLREHRGEVWSWEELAGGSRAIEPVGDESALEDVAAARDLGARVRAAVADLPEGQRSAVLLFYLSGLTYEETANTIGIPIGAVKARLHKARSSLRKRLLHLWKEETEMPAAAQPVDVRVKDVRRRPPEGDKPPLHMVILEEVGGRRRLPIWVGPFEGTAIALHAEGIEVPRPLTFTLMARLVEATGYRLAGVVISRLVGDTFYAIARLDGPAGRVEVDARPSDVITLALVAGAPIVVEPGVFDASDAAERHEGWSEDKWLGEGTMGRAEIVADVREKWPGYSQRE